MSIFYPRFHFEVRYSHILNFSTVVKDVLSPYLRLVTSFKISNQGLLEENIKLLFEDDAYAIDVRWDKIIFTAENDINRFNDENSPISIFFEILDKLGKKESFGMITNCVFMAVMVNISEEKHEKILKDFKGQYLNSNTDKFFTEPDDIAIVLEKQENDRLTSITIGPYSPKDIPRRNLIPFKSQELFIKLAEKNGIMMEMKVFENNKNINFKYFKELIKLSNNYIKLM